MSVLRAFVSLLVTQGNDSRELSLLTHSASRSPHGAQMLWALEKGQGIWDRADELVPRVEGTECGILRGSTLPATNSRGNTSTSGMLVFPLKVSSNGITLLPGEQLYLPGNEFILRQQKFVGVELSCALKLIISHSYLSY